MVDVDVIYICICTHALLGACQYKPGVASILGLEIVGCHTRSRCSSGTLAIGNDSIQVCLSSAAAAQALSSSFCFSLLLRERECVCVIIPTSHEDITSVSTWQYCRDRSVTEYAGIQHKMQLPGHDSRLACMAEPGLSLSRNIYNICVCVCRERCRCFSWISRPATGTWRRRSAFEMAPITLRSRPDSRGCC